MPTSQLWDEMNKQQIPDEDVREGSVEPDDYTPEWDPHVTDDVDEMRCNIREMLDLLSDSDIKLLDALIHCLEGSCTECRYFGKCEKTDRLALDIFKRIRLY